SVGTPTAGTVENHGSFLIYRAGLGFAGDTFTYSIVDAAGNTSTAAVTLRAPATATRSTSINWDHVVDVTNSIGVQYHRTSWNERIDTLYADLDLANIGTYTIRGPILLGVKNLDNPLVAVHGVDGVSPDGIPYYDI